MVGSCRGCYLVGRVAVLRAKPEETFTVRFAKVVGLRSTPKYMKSDNMNRSGSVEPFGKTSLD